MCRTLEALVLVCALLLQSDAIDSDSDSDSDLTWQFVGAESAHVVLKWKSVAEVAAVVSVTNANCFVGDIAVVVIDDTVVATQRLNDESHKVAHLESQAAVACLWSFDAIPIITDGAHRIRALVFDGADIADEHTSRLHGINVTVLLSKLSELSTTPMAASTEPTPLYLPTKDDLDMRGPLHRAHLHQSMEGRDDALRQRLTQRLLSPPGRDCSDSAQNVLGTAACPTLVYALDTKVQCIMEGQCRTYAGGLGDRLEGIASAAATALITRRRFVITDWSTTPFEDFFTSPFHIKGQLLPEQPDAPGTPLSDSDTGLPLWEHYDWSYQGSCDDARRSVGSDSDSESQSTRTEARASGASEGPSPHAGLAAAIASSHPTVRLLSNQYALCVILANPAWFERLITSDNDIASDIDATNATRHGVDSEVGVDADYAAVQSLFRELLGTLLGAATPEYPETTMDADALNINDHWGASATRMLGLSNVAMDKAEFTLHRAILGVVLPLPAPAARVQLELLRQRFRTAPRVIGVQIRQGDSNVPGIPNQWWDDQLSSKQQWDNVIECIRGEIERKGSASASASASEASASASGGHGSTASDDPSSSGKPLIFVSADTENAAQILKEALGGAVTDVITAAAAGPTAHVDRNAPAHAAAATTRVAVDLLALGECDDLVVSFHSRFGRIATMLSPRGAGVDFGSLVSSTSHMYSPLEIGHGLGSESESGYHYSHIAGLEMDRRVTVYSAVLNHVCSNELWVAPFCVRMSAFMLRGKYNLPESVRPYIGQKAI